MKQLLDQALVDCSTQSEFCFSLQCVECKKIWRSKSIFFSKAGVDPPTEEKRIIYRTLYQREKARARENALKEALEKFNFCPICQQLVCDHCFLICSDLDMCCRCAERLKEDGEPVRTDRNAGFLSNGACVAYKR